MFPQFLFTACFIPGYCLWMLIYIENIEMVMSCSFGKILASRAIRAAHCLTSIQVFFSFICIHVCKQKKGNPGAVVKLLPFDHEVMCSSPENNLLQKCREMMRI
jgi:hypothetical protein